MNHANIIRYCNRPFRSVEEMNDFILNAWNTTVGKNDIVYFLGDLAFGNTRYWLSQLNGKIIFLRGNHDKPEKIRFYDRLILNCEDQRFLLVHDPKDIPPNWKDWVIHGHTHNNKPEYPLVDKNKKTINVSAELLGYKPISWEELRQLI